MDTNRNSIISSLNIFGSPEPSDTEPKPQQSPRPRYLNTPKYPGTSNPRAKYTPGRSSSQDTLRKRLRVAKMLTSFPRISDDTPPTSPPDEGKSEKKATSPAALQLAKILKDSQLESLKSTVAPTLMSPTDGRLIQFRDLSVQSVEVETVDMRADLVPNSPTQYVRNYMETPPASPYNETNEQSSFFTLVSSTSNRISRALSSANHRPSVVPHTKPETLTKEDEPIFHNTMKQKVPNPGKAKSSRPPQPANNPRGASGLRFRQTPNPHHHSQPTGPNPLFPKWSGTSQPMSTPDEIALQRHNPAAFKEYTRAELAQQGRLSFEDLCRLAPRLVAERGWVFDPEFLVRERCGVWERERAGKAACAAAAAAKAAEPAAAPMPVGVTVAIAEGSVKMKRTLGRKMRLALGRRVVLAAKERGVARSGTW